MTINLPESVRKIIEERIAAGEFASAESYVQALVEADQRRDAQRRFEAELAAALAEPAEPFTKSDLDDVRRIGRERLNRPRERRR
jgi:Arc/MetJ-type ribon-helix-helix transcriptional regulator